MKHDRILTLMMASVLSFTSIIISGGLHTSAEEDTQNVQTSTAPEAQATGTTQVGSMLSERLNKEASKMQDTEGCNPSLSAFVKTAYLVKNPLDTRLFYTAEMQPELRV